MPYVYYPTTPVLDDCNRANESPISFGGRWNVLNDITLYPSVVGSKIDTNRIISTSLPNSSTALWLPSTFSDCEVWAECNSTQTNTVAFFCRVGTPGTGTTTGYRLVVSGASFTLARITNSVATTLSTFSLGVPGLLGRIMMRAVGSRLSVNFWRSSDILQNWYEVLSAEDATYSTGSLALAMNGSFPGFTKFGGGPTSGIIGGGPALTSGRGATW